MDMMPADDYLAECICKLNHQDSEEAHIAADAILCDILREKYPKTVAAFESLNKWYA